METFEYLQSKTAPAQFVNAHFFHIQGLASCFSGDDALQHVRSNTAMF